MNKEICKICNKPMANSLNTDDNNNPCHKGCLPPVKRKCQKCGRSSAIDKHHIIARVYGGSDEAKNKIDLCSICHREWHIIEECTKLTFEEWMKLPSLDFLLITFHHLLKLDRKILERQNGFELLSDIITANMLKKKDF